MRKIYFTSLLFLFVAASYAQDVDCYNYYYKAFEDRGAYNVEDGVHDTKVIVSIRSGNDIDCYEGKVEVKNGVIVKIFLKFVDETFEVYNPKFKNDYATTIKNGVSRSQITMEDEIINVFFLDKIKPKKKNYKKAKLIKLDDL